MIRRCTSAAPDCRSMATTARVVVPRTIESSTTTSRLPAMFSRSGLSFMRTPRLRRSWLGAMKVRPMYRFLTRPSPYGRPLTRAKPCAAGTPLSGTGITMAGRGGSAESGGRGACSASCSPMRTRAAATLAP